MAVTYAWRLDADKYAYILDPQKLNPQNDDDYGFITNEPLNGQPLANVQQAANELFGVDSGIEGKEKYIKAVSVMEKKIREEWGDFDLLSGDVYHNVDAFDCANLRGVGIKGIKYLGVGVPPEGGTVFDINNPAWNPSGSIYEAGAILVYGVYMEDQDPQKDEYESFFAVRNGFANDSIDSDSTSGLEEMINNEALARETKDNELRGEIQNIKNTINNLTTIGGSADLTELNEVVNGLANDIENLTTRIATIEEFLKSNTPDGTGGNASVNWGTREAGRTYSLIATDDDGSFYKIDDLYVKDADSSALTSKDGFYEE